jgi:hypothetical protein
MTNSSDFCNNHSREVGECPQEGLAVTNTIMKSEIERRRHRRAVNTLGRLAFTTLGPPLFLISYLVVATTTAHAETVSGSLFWGARSVTAATQHRPRPQTHPAAIPRLP